jgi:SAM-dependent methyltransferase
MNERHRSPVTEFETAAREDHSYAEAYEQLAVPALFVGWASSMVGKAPPALDAEVLDVGCGTGIVARTASRHLGPDGQVTGIDSDAAMLQVARNAAVGVGRYIQWLEGDASRLPVADNQFDIIYCQQALQFVADPLSALREMRRVLRPGGRVALNTWRGVRDPCAARAFGGVLAMHLGADAANELSAPCGFDDPKAIGNLLAASGVTVLSTGVLTHEVRVASADSLLDIASLITSLGPWLTTLAADARRSLASDLERSLSDRAGGEITLPVEASFAIAQR